MAGGARRELAEVTGIGAMGGFAVPEALGGDEAGVLEAGGNAAVFDFALHDDGAAEALPLGDGGTGSAGFRDGAGAGVSPGFPVVYGKPV